MNVRDKEMSDRAQDLASRLRHTAGEAFIGKTEVIAEVRLLTQAADTLAELVAECQRLSYRLAAATNAPEPAAG